MSSATDELRRLLDERGVEWREHTELQGEITLWDGWQFFEGTARYNDGYSMLSMVDATPEQAVEATLGRGTCKRVKEYFGRSGKSCREVCSECHHIIYDGWQDKPRYCPFCGRMVRS